METLYDVESIKECIPHRYPFLLLDRIVLLEEEKIQGIKNVTVNENFFMGHFPKRAIMPGVLQVEAMAQLAAFYAIKRNGASDPDVFFLSIKNAKFRSPVVPGDQLLIEVSINTFSGSRMSFTGRCLVDGKVVSEAEMMAMIKN